MNKKNVLKQFMLMGMMAEGLQDDARLNYKVAPQNGGTTLNPRPTPKTKKQKKARAKAKRARKARKK